MWWTPGTPTINSSQSSFSTNSTALSVAEVILTTSVAKVDQNYAGFVEVGGSTLVEWWIEHCHSAGFGDTALRSTVAKGELARMVVFSPLYQTATYPVKFYGAVGDRLRVRIAAAVTGTLAAKIQIEPQG